MNPLLFQVQSPATIGVALALGILAAIGLTMGRLDPAGRKRCWQRWRLRASPLQQGLVLSTAVMACGSLLAGAVLGRPGLGAIGLGLALLLALLLDDRVRSFIAQETKRRHNEMRHWEVRKPAEHRMAHQARLQRQELDRVQDQSLRRLMDPHFLFNALNGIMHDMMTLEWNRAVSHLKAFNRLAERQILAGQQGWWTLQEEWESLHDYVQLEVRRLGRPITWTLAPIPPDLIGTRIPALMIQPIVENALWHGLGGTSHDGPGTLLVEMEMLEEGRILISVRNTPSNTSPEEATDPVRPEGEQSRRRHASDLIRQRLHLLDRTGQCGYTIEHDAEGTTARIVMPYSSIG